MTGVLWVIMLTVLVGLAVIALTPETVRPPRKDGE